MTNDYYYYYYYYYSKITHEINEMGVKLRFPLISLFLLVFVKLHGCWIFSGQDTTSAKKAVALDAKGEAGRFELKTSDDTFLAQAQTYLQLSPLDQCNYRVINHLKRSCSDMCEEELNKMAVHLLNCQLLSENRPTFECEEFMSIGECTSGMDATQWNSYQIVANRARAVCYHTRQQIFRIKTEAAVNRLVKTSHEQINGMEKLREDQEKLGRVTADTLHKVDATQHEMMLRHEKMKSSQMEMEQHIVKNLKSLTREKALIAAGQKEVAEMTEGLKTRLERTAEAMERQGEVQGDTHEEIIRDLAVIREQAQEVMKKMSGNAETIAAYQSITHEHYEETLNSLRQVNASVNFVISTVNALQDGVYAKLGWLEIALGGTGDKVAFLKIVCSHILYLLLAVLSAIFLRTPPFTRLFLILLIPLNALAEIRGKSSLDFTLMTLFILFSATANMTFNFALGLFSSVSVFKSAREESSTTTSTDLTTTTVVASLSKDAELAEASELARVGGKSSRKSSDSRRLKRGSKSRSRSRSRSRGRVRRISSSSSEGTVDAEKTDPTFVPPSIGEDSLEDSRMPSRLSSTLITNSVHLTAKFGETFTPGCTEVSGTGLPSLGKLVSSSTPMIGVPDRSYSENALSALRLVPHEPNKSGTGSPSSCSPTPSITNAPPSSGSSRPVFANIAANAFLKENFVKTIDSSVKGARDGKEYSSSSALENAALNRSRRRSSSRGRTFVKGETDEIRNSDKENTSGQINDQSLRSQSLITNHFVDDRSSRRSRTPPRVLSATFDNSTRTSPMGKTPQRGRPRSKTPPRSVNLSRMPCGATTKNGTMCKNGANFGKEFCALHSKLV